jgi:hypothetical protein
MKPNVLAFVALALCANPPALPADAPLSVPELYLAMIQMTGKVREELYGLDGPLRLDRMVCTRWEALGEGSGWCEGAALVRTAEGSVLKGELTVELQAGRAQNMAVRVNGLRTANFGPAMQGLLGKPCAKEERRPMWNKEGERNGDALSSGWLQVDQSLLVAVLRGSNGDEMLAVGTLANESAKSIAKMKAECGGKP